MGFHRWCIHYRAGRKTGRVFTCGENSGSAEWNFSASSVFDCLWGTAGGYGDCSYAYFYRGGQSGALSVRGAGVYGL